MHHETEQAEETEEPSDVRVVQGELVRDAQDRGPQVVPAERRALGRLRYQTRVWYSTERNTP